MNWIVLWFILGTVWSLYALNKYNDVTNRSMTTWWQIFNIFLNTLILPIGILAGFFIFIVGKRSVEYDLDKIDFNFTVIRLLTYYTGENEKNDKEN